MMLLVKNCIGVKYFYKKIFPMENVDFILSVEMRVIRFFDLIKRFILEEVLTGVQEVQNDRTDAACLASPFIAEYDRIVIESLEPIFAGRPLEAASGK